MARTVKKGLDYFPLDVQMEDKIKLIEAKYGMEGFGILIRLYQKIYSNGYFIKWKQENALLFSNEINVDINKINDIILDCLCWNVFNKCLHEKYKILTSHGIQVRYVEATYRRKKVKIIEEISTLSEDELNKNVVYVNINEVNDDIKAINDNINSQSKVKESKVKESNSNSCSDSKKSSPNSIPDKPKFDKESTPYKTAVHLRKLILDNNPRQPVPDDSPQDLEDWAIELDRLNRLGPVGGKEHENKGYSWEEIGEIMEWCQDHHFWKSNILSAGKFREQITKLENQMKNEKNKNNKSNEKIDQLKELYAEAEQEDENNNSEVDVL